TNSPWTTRSPGVTASLHTRASLPTSGRWTGHRQRQSSGGPSPSNAFPVLGRSTSERAPPDRRASCTLGGDAHFHPGGRPVQTTRRRLHRIVLRIVQSPAALPWGSLFTSSAGTGFSGC